MRQFSVQNDPDNLGYVVTFIEQGRALQAQVWRHSKNLLDFRAALLLTWIAGLLDRFGLGGTIIGKLARAVPVPNKEGHHRHFAGGLLLYIAAALLISTVLALFAGPGTGKFQFHMAGNVMGFVALYAAFAFVAYLFFLLRAQSNNRTDAAFRRRITVSAANMEVVIESDQDRLKAEAFGRSYRPVVVRMSQVVGVEDHHVSAHTPSVNATGYAGGERELANWFEVSLFTSEGRRFTLTSDTGGPDTAREIRTRLATLIHKCQTVLPRYQRLHETNSYSDAAHADLAAMLYNTSSASSASPASSARSPYLNAVPESDRL